MEPEMPRSVEVILDNYFAAKNSRSVNETMAYFSRDLTTYTDTTLGWTLDGFAAVHATFAQYMPGWEGGASIPIRVLGDARSAVVEFVDTAELFGGELHILGSVDFDEDGRIVRWLDHWDRSTFDPSLFARIAVPENRFPVAIAQVSERATGEMAALARTLHGALADGDLEHLRGLLARQVVFEDMATHRRIGGRDAVLGHLAGIAHSAPFGPSSTFVRALGGASGGGFEWLGSPASRVRRGLTALEVGDDRSITRLTIAYDGARLPPTDGSDRMRAGG